MPSKIKSVTVTLDDATYETLVKVAEAEDRTIPRQMARVVRQWAEGYRAEGVQLPAAEPF